ncbi:hypothetical protein E2C01_093353 [Portunus trituberculatus]|uniref:Uncharacterized protein n=1 Tax=Portunus trituberculatus TaxID=210409 RepID=A0A5B7JTS2_PORTR|nr:hypothetical protein [Portunus trituberculatus]
MQRSLARRRRPGHAGHAVRAGAAAQCGASRREVARRGEAHTRPLFNYGSEGGQARTLVEQDTH